MERSSEDKQLKPEMDVTCKMFNHDQYIKDMMDLCWNLLNKYIYNNI